MHIPMINITHMESKYSNHAYCSRHCTILLPACVSKWCATGIPFTHAVLFSECDLPFCPYSLTRAPFCNELQFADYVRNGRVTRYSGSDGSCHYDRRSVSACTLIDNANPPPQYQVSESVSQSYSEVCCNALFEGAKLRPIYIIHIRLS